MFGQESVNRLALFVSLAQWASSRYAEDVGSIPAGYVATAMWQAIAFGFFHSYKTFLTIRQPVAGALSLVRFQTPVFLYNKGEEKHMGMYDKAQNACIKPKKN